MSCWNDQGRKALPTPSTLPSNGLFLAPGHRDPLDGRLPTEALLADAQTSIAAEKRGMNPMPVNLRARPPARSFSIGGLIA